MRRKVIKQGNNSYTLTLPITWVRQNNLMSGGEIVIEEEENLLKLSTEQKLKAKSISVALVDNNPRGIRFLLQQAYRQNYGQIIVEYPTLTVYQTMLNIVDHYFLGVEVVTKQKNSCTLSILIETNEEKFQLFLRKMFLLIRDSLGLLASSDFEGIHYNYLKLYAYQNYGKRYLYSQKAQLSSYDYYSLLSYLLNIHSDIEKCVLVRKSLKHKFSAGDEFVKLSLILAEIEKYFYSKKLNKLMEIEETLQKMIVLPSSFNSRENYLFFHYQMEIARLLYGALSPLLGIVLYEAHKSS